MYCNTLWEIKPHETVVPAQLERKGKPYRLVLSQIIAEDFSNVCELYLQTFSIVETTSVFKRRICKHLVGLQIYSSDRVLADVQTWRATKHTYCEHRDLRTCC